MTRWRQWGQLCPIDKGSSRAPTKACFQNLRMPCAAAAYPTPGHQDKPMKLE
jgi:hypothetical protein